MAALVSIGTRRRVRKPAPYAKGGRSGHPLAGDAGRWPSGTVLLSLKAGGVGLNLQCAERVVLLDPWWNPAVEAQAIDRTHRIGQTRSVHAIRLVSAGTVEDRVLDLQARKRSLADAIVGGDAGPLASMTREDLAFLLQTG